MVKPLRQSLPYQGSLALASWTIPEPRYPIAYARYLKSLWWHKLIACSTGDRWQQQAAPAA